MELSMVVCRDYRSGSAYEYVIYGKPEGSQEDGTIVARKGFFGTYSQAKRAGLKAAEQIDSAA